MSEIVVEIEIVEFNGVWYRKGLDWKGVEVWEELEDGEYGEDLSMDVVEFEDMIINSVNEERIV